MPPEDQQTAPAFTLDQRIYYEDTDAAGIVYHANYLKFAERARTEWLRVRGVTLTELRAREGIRIVVRSCECIFSAPARLDDQIRISCWSGLRKGPLFFIRQQISCLDPAPATGEDKFSHQAGLKLVRLRFGLLCINQEGSLVRPPSSLEALFTHADPETATDSARFMVAAPGKGTYGE